MKKKLTALLVACAIPTLAFSAEQKSNTDSAQQAITSSLSKQNASTDPATDEETTTDKINKMVGGESIGSSSANNSLDSAAPKNPPNKNVRPQLYHPIPPRPDMTESPTCLYDNSRFSEGAVVSVEKSRAIQCDNRKDTQGRVVAIWKLIK